MDRWAVSGERAEGLDKEQAGVQEEPAEALRVEWAEDSMELPRE